MKLIAFALCFIVLMASVRSIEQIPTMSLDEDEQTLAMAIYEQSEALDMEFDELDEVNKAKAATEAVAGIIAGAFGHHLSILHCYHDSKYVASHFSAVYHGFRKGHKAGVKSGLTNIGRIMHSIPGLIKHCKGVSKIIPTIRRMAVIFSNPTLLEVHVGKNIIFHGKSIYHHVKSTVSNYKKHHWFSFGVQVGITLDLVLFKAQQVTDAQVEAEFGNALESDGIDFMEGFTHGLNPAVYEDAKVCFQDIQQDTVDKIVADINDLDWKHMERSVGDIQDIMNIVVGVIKDCKTGSQSLQDFVQRLLHAMDTMNFIEAALSIIENPLKFYRMVESIKKDVKDHDFFDAGDITGDFVGDVLRLHMVSMASAMKESS